MNTTTLTKRPWYRDYRAYRRQGWRPIEAYCHARTIHRFKHAEFLGLVSLDTVEDDDWRSAIECGCEEREKCEAENRERAKWMGVRGIVSYATKDPYNPCDCYSAPKCEHFDFVDSMFGFIGDDWKDSGYDTDLMNAALDAVAVNTRRQFYTI